MEIIVGKYSGFCNGVRYTVNIAEKELEKNGEVYSLGDIVHNEIVMDNFKEKGLIVTNNIGDIPNGAKVIIRAHGEGIGTYEKARDKNLNIIDLTCGKVKLIHTKILKNKDNYFILIIGKTSHPETIAHHSYSKNSFVIENAGDVTDAYNTFLKSGFKEVYIVAQTTFSETLFMELVNLIKKVFIDVQVIVDNTICNATSLRQDEVANIAKHVDKMIIIGGKNSSNTKELSMIANKYCLNTYLIQSYEELFNIVFNDSDIIGIEAGASTPKEQVDDVVKYLNNLYKKIKC